jgi:hypothetical protein
VTYDAGNSGVKVRREMEMTFGSHAALAGATA